MDMVYPDKWQGAELENVDVSVNKDGIIVAAVRRLTWLCAWMLNVISQRADGQEYNEARTL